MAPEIFQILSGFEVPSILKWIHTCSLEHNSLAAVLPPCFVAAVGVAIAIPTSSAAPGVAAVLVVAAVTAFGSAISEDAVLVGTLAVVVPLPAVVGVVLGCLTPEEELESPANTAETKGVGALICQDSGALAAPQIAVAAA